MRAGSASQVGMCVEVPSPRKLGDGARSMGDSTPILHAERSSFAARGGAPYNRAHGCARKRWPRSSGGA